MGCGPRHQHRAQQQKPREQAGVARRGRCALVPQRRRAARAAGRQLHHHGGLQQREWRQEHAAPRGVCGRHCGSGPRVPRCARRPTAPPERRLAAHLQRARRGLQPLLLCGHVAAAAPEHPRGRQREAKRVGVAAAGWGQGLARAAHAAAAILLLLAAHPGAARALRLLLRGLPQRPVHRGHLELYHGRHFFGDEQRERSRLDGQQYGSHRQAAGVPEPRDGAIHVASHLLDVRGEQLLVLAVLHAAVGLARRRHEQNRPCLYVVTAGPTLPPARAPRPPRRRQPNHHPHRRLRQRREQRGRRAGWSVQRRGHAGDWAAAVAQDTARRRLGGALG
mmetsp:Transcript_6245/g.22995  ORF Transcript_6245/g.22995 Transcript_6245/m.22995 type:complete len:335 (+) Transcript_6245:2747-3751(+)